MSTKEHGPYPPTHWSLGGRATRIPDIPITAVLMVMYIGSAATHMTIYQLNKRRGHTFLFNGVLFGFSMTRTVTTALRIASTCVPNNLSLAIAAQIFVAIGVVIIYVVNMLFARRIIRAQHPAWGWNRAFSFFYNAVFVIIVVTLLMVITSAVQSFYTLNTNTLRIDRDIQLYAATCYGVVSILPALLISISLMIPRKRMLDRFGTGRLRHNIAIVIAGTLFVSSGAWYRCATSWKDPVSRSEPLPGYFHKACFYVFNFVVELCVVYLYALVRVDRRFYVPDGAKGPGSYSTTLSVLPSRDIRTGNSESIRSLVTNKSKDVEGQKDMDDDSDDTTGAF